MVTCWIQTSDFSSSELGELAAHGAVRTFQEYDWDGELSRRASLEEQGEEFCDPGIGFVAGDGRILHVCPLENGRAYFHYHFPKERRLLGFVLGRSQKIVSKFDIGQSEIPELIQRFFSSEHSWLLAKVA